MYVFMESQSPCTLFKCSKSSAKQNHATSTRLIKMLSKRVEPSYAPRADH